MRILFLVLMVTLVAWQSAGLVLHRSFRTREAGFGFGTAKVKVVISRCKCVSDGDTRHVATGNAHHYAHFDHTPAYATAEAAAKEKKLGLWGGDNPMRPYDWRRSKRKM